MLLELNSRTEITLNLYQQVAWHGHGVRFGSPAVQRMTECRNEFLSLLDKDPPVTIYGVTTGYGHQANLRLEGDARRVHARRHPEPACRVWATVPDRVARELSSRAWPTLSRAMPP